MTTVTTTVRGLRMHWRNVMAAVQSGVPVVVLRGKQPMAVLVNYATWSGETGETTRTPAPPSWQSADDQPDGRERGWGL